MTVRAVRIVVSVGTVGVGTGLVLGMIENLRAFLNVTLEMGKCDNT